MKQRGKLRRHHYNLLVNPSFKTLDLSRERKDLKLALELAAIRCTDLRSLNLAGCMLWKSALEWNIPSFTRLTNLCLSGTNVSDEDLIVVGAYGYNLEEIDLMCTNIRKGLGYLVKDPKLPGAIEAGKCQRLRMINVDHCHVESESVTTVLRCLPDLLEIRYQDLVRVIFSILQDSPGASFKLVSLCDANPTGTKFDACDDAPVMSDYVLEAVLKSCPNVARFDLTAYPTMSEVSLLPLASHNYAIREFRFTGCGSLTLDEPVSCLNTLTPVFSPTARGADSLLTTLILTGVADVNIPLLIELCPRLVHLALHDIVSFTTEMPHDVRRNKNNFWSDLRTMQLWCKSSVQSPDEDTMHQLLKAPKLSKLEVLYCDSLDDDCLQRVKEHNAFKDLEKLSLIQCNNITLAPLVSLLLGENSLNHVQLHRCQHVTLRDVEFCRKHIASSKLSDYITIDWY